MVVLSARIEIELSGCFSLKDKRRVLRSILDRVQLDRGAAAGEVGDWELWNRAEIGVAAVSSSFDGADKVLRRVVELVESHPSVTACHIERHRFDA